MKHRIAENNFLLAAGPGRITIEIIKFKFRNFDNKQPALVTKFSLTLFVFLLRPFQFLALISACLRALNRKEQPLPLPYKTLGGLGNFCTNRSFLKSYY